MKKLLLTLTMLLCMSGAFGQTGQKHIAKYKALPNAEYKENTEEVRRNIEENKKKGTFGLMGKGLLVAFDRKVKKDQMLKGIMSSNIIRF